MVLASDGVNILKRNIMKNDATKLIRSETLENAPLQYAPQNELGVVFLFSQIANKLRIKVEQIRPQYPDCITYLKKRLMEKKRIRIEFIEIYYKGDKENENRERIVKYYKR